MALLLSSCGFFPESSFELAPSSRLPSWFSLPAGMPREQVSVTLDYYTSSTRNNATFILYDSHKRKLKKVSGTGREGGPLTLKSPAPGYPPGYPMYEVITVNGVTDVVEHRAMEPIFYMTDDPSVREEIGAPANKRLERP